jgi:hypothetical protein
MAPRENPPKRFHLCWPIRDDLAPSRIEVPADDRSSPEARALSRAESTLLRTSRTTVLSAARCGARVGLDVGTGASRSGRQPPSINPSLSASCPH